VAEDVTRASHPFWNPRTLQLKSPPVSVPGLIGFSSQGMAVRGIATAMVTTNLEEWGDHAASSVSSVP
jgi:hypothetical protein